jgi:hypothetical protein
MKAALDQASEVYTSLTNTSAMRMLNAAPVSVGFTQDDDGITLVPAINRLW